MSWNIEQKWRVFLIAGIIVAFLGPWAYERISVPAKYACSPPFIRLEGDFCGTPVLGVQIFLGIIGQLIWTVGSLFSGEFDFSAMFRQVSIGMFLLSPLLPIVSNILLVRREEHRSRMIFHIISWICAIGACIFLLVSFEKFYVRLWGVWLYLGFAVGGLITEILILFRSKNHLE